MKFESLQRDSDYPQNSFLYKMQTFGDLSITKILKTYSRA